jgi:3-deoxy-D-manno-octulosonate 8-phosphate phosphatase KdsC-like HAD superfamily phosphatase
MGKVVVITGELTEGIRRRVASLGIERCLGKPFKIEEIREVVNRASGDRG